MPLGPTADAAPVAGRRFRRRGRQHAPGSPVSGRRVRTVHRVEVRDAARLGLLATLVMVAVGFVAALVLWVGAAASGTVDDVESFVTDLGFGDCEVVDAGAASAPAAAVDSGDGDCPAGERLAGGFEFRPGGVLAVLAVAGVVVVVAGTALATLAALIGNALAELSGGLRVTVSDGSAPGGARSPGSEPAD